MTSPVQARRADIFLHVGDFQFTSGRVRLRTVLGSCVAITAWHPIRRMGGMCHYLLPSARDGVPVQQQGSATYADRAFELFNRAFEDAGSTKEEYVIKMFGGGSMFPQFSAGQGCEAPCDVALPPPNCRDIPCRNVTQGQHLFTTHGFTMAGGDTGGLGSRQVIFDVWTGEVWVRKGVPPAGRPE